jgi:hypothetical protein
MLTRQLGQNILTDQDVGFWDCRGCAQHPDSLLPYAKHMLGTCWADVWRVIDICHDMAQAKHMPGKQMPCTSLQYARHMHGPCIGNEYG